MKMTSAINQDRNIADIVSLFSEGISRFLCVVDGNKEYDLILESHLSPKMREIYSENVNLDIRRSNAVKSARTVLAKSVQSSRRLTFSGFACYGQTKNNIREFDFFNSICAPIGVSIDDANYIFAEKLPAPKLTQGQTAALLAIEALIEEFYAARFNLTAGLVRQCNIYFGAFYSFLLSFTAPGAVHPAALVVANDHSPTHVALSMIAKAMKIPRIYLQHAEVNKLFPPLDFEYSILRNARSREIYAQINSLPDHVHVIPRDPLSHELGGLAEPLAEPVDVVIYPTARIIDDGIRRLIEGLLKNPLVSSVAVKEHPNTSKKLSDWLVLEGLRYLDTIPATAHVALVGNSSIAVELIGKGIPVYQNFDFDPVARDYYGFVKSGFLREVGTDRLGDRFWTPFNLDENWRAECSKWIPLDAGTDDRAAFLSAMERIATTIIPAHSGAGTFPDAQPATRPATRPATGPASVPAGRPASGAPAPKPKSAPDQSKVDFIVLTLRSLKEPGPWLAETQSLGLFDPVLIMRAVDLLVARRDPAVSGILGADLGLDPGSDLAAWFELKRSARSAVAISSGRIGEILDTLGTGTRDAKMRREIERVLLLAVIDYGTDHQVISFVDLLSIPWTSLGAARQFNLIMRLSTIPSQRDRAVALRAKTLDDASDLGRLRFENVEFFAGEPPAGWSHESAERRFVDAVPEPVRRQYDTEVRPLFDRFRPRMTLMNLSTDQDERTAFLGMARAALSAGTGFSCIRLSDGEGALFPEAGYFSHEDTLNRERHWWRIELSQEKRTQIRTSVHRALAEADVIGLPSIYRFIRDTTDTSKSLTGNLQGRGLLSCLYGMTATPIADRAQFSEDKFNDRLFGDVATVTQLAAAATSVVIVSSIRPEFLPRDIQVLRGVDYVQLTTHSNTVGNDMYVQSDVPLPESYQDLMDDYDRKIGPGTLVLVAGGVIGKIFIGRARERGAVALDLGHVMDSWASARRTTLR